jgi:hypothetical protein
MRAALCFIFFIGASRHDFDSVWRQFIEHYIASLQTAVAAHQNKG